MAPVKYFLNNPRTAHLVVILVVLIGGVTLFQLSRSLYPNVDFDIIRITTMYPGASAEDVEINVTNAIEEELETVSGIEKIISVSLENLSLIYTFVDTDAPDIDSVKDDIARAVDRVPDLPKEIDGKPLIKELRASNVAVLEIAIYGKVTELELRKIAKDLEDAVNDIDGVSSVEKVGYRKREVQIEPSIASLAKEYISLIEVVESIRNHNVREAGGNLESFSNEKKIVTFSEFDNPLDVKNVIVRSNFSGRQVRLDHIATIRDGFEDFEVMSRTKGQNSINLLVRSQSGADIINISNDIKKLLEVFKQTTSDNVSISLVSDYSYYTKNMLGIVRTNALIGFFLVLICLFVFLTRHVAIWTALGIPISIFGAILTFPLFDVQIDMITLISMIIVLGLIVDDAIVVAENISRNRENGLGPFEASLTGVGEVFWPVLTTILTTILAFVPIAFMTGVTGKFVFHIPIVVTAMLVMSLIESTLILPAHIAHSRLRKPKQHRWFLALKRYYSKVLETALRYRAATLASFVGFLIATFMLFFLGLKFVLFPYTDVDIFHVIAELPDGYTLEETSDKLKEIEQLVQGIPKEQILGYTTRVGHHDTDVYGGTSGIHANWGLINVYLKPASERTITSETILADLEKKLKHIRGFKKLYAQQFYDGPPIGKPITVTLVGDDDNIRRHFTQKMMTFLKHMNGVKAVEVDEKKGKEELRLKPNFEAMARLGVTARHVANTIRAAYEGIVPTQITRHGEEIDFRVQLAENERRRPEIIKQLQVLNPQGRLVRLGSFISIARSEAYETIKHYNGRRSSTVTADVDTHVITSKEANQLIRMEFENTIEAIPGFRLILGGEEKATQESMESFLIAFICAIIAIYFVLVVLFNSFWQPLLILAAVPFAMGGVFIVFYVHNQPISFLAMIGALGLIGVVVNDSLIMVSHLNRLRKGRKLSAFLVIQGAKERFRPVLLTSITTVMAMVPTIYGFGGYEPFIVPIVLALTGGLIFATGITLILVPTLYSLPIPRKRTKRSG